MNRKIVKKLQDAELARLAILLDAELQNRIRRTLEEEGNDFFTRHFIPANEEPALDSDQFATVFAFQTYLNGLNAEIPEHLATDK